MSALDAAPRPARDCAPRLSDYVAERTAYRLDVPERFNAVEAIVDRWAREAPDDPAVLSLDGTGEPIGLASAAELARDSRMAARALAELGIAKGDHVFVMLPRCPEWYAALLGCMHRGGADARAEPPDRQGHRLPGAECRRGRGDHRHRGRRQGR